MLTRNPHPHGRHRRDQPDHRDSTAHATDIVERRTKRNVQSVLMFLIAVLGVAIITWGSGGHGSLYGLGALSVLIVKMAGSTLDRPHTGPAPELTTALVVPTYNEDPDAFARCLRSVLTQTRPVDEIWVIDDGSTSGECLRVAHEILDGHLGAVVDRMAANAGKRHAQGYAFTRSQADVFITVDSDTVLEVDAVENGLRPFGSPKVQAVTGNVRALNHRRNLLTRLIDLRYANAFLYERAAYSAVGSVVCCCGSLSLIRGDVVRDNLGDYLTQTFLGIEVQYGDDRRLTQYALQRGHVVVQDTAVAYTAVPERLRHFARQQLRWNKSFFRESMWAIVRFGPRRWPFWISLLEVITWVAFSTGLILALYVRPLSTGQPPPWYYLAYAILLAYARNVRYFGRPNCSVGYQVATFALAPLYAALHVVLLTPLRLWALCTLRQKGWGTRGTVEVTLSDDAHDLTPTLEQQP